MGYLETLQTYKYQVKYWPGAKNAVADALSRSYELDMTGCEDRRFQQQVILSAQSEENTGLNVSTVLSGQPGSK
jgi:hypothetical protein